MGSVYKGTSVNEKRLVVSLAIGDVYKKYAEVTFPLIKAYASKCGADFITRTESSPEYEIPGYQKWYYLNYLTEYDRILHIDADMIVRSTTPNLFEMVPKQYFAGVDELPYQNLEEEHPSIDRIEDMLTLKDFEPHPEPFYINVGMYLFSKAHTHVFDTPVKDSPCYFKEQAYINKNLHKTGNVMLLDPKFNYMKLMENAGLYKEDAYIIHYAGSYGGLSTEDIIELMKKDIR